MADCSKTEVFLAELERMCYSCDAVCSGCGFEESGDCGQISVLCECGQAVVQKWSDEHPAPKPKTYADVFFEMHKQAMKGCDNTPFCCREVIFGTRTTREPCTKQNGCGQCWNEPYPEQEESK